MEAYSPLIWTGIFVMVISGFIISFSGVAGSKAGTFLYPFFLLGVASVVVGSIVWMLSLKSK